MDYASIYFYNRVRTLYVNITGEEGEGEGLAIDIRNVIEKMDLFPGQEEGCCNRMDRGVTPALERNRGD